MVGDKGKPTDEKLGIDDAVVDVKHGIGDLSHRRGRRIQITRPVSRLRHLAPIVVGHYLSVIVGADVWSRQALHVIANAHHQLVGHEALLHQVQCHSVGHLLYHHTSLCHCIGFRQHLTVRQGMCLGSVGLDVLNGARFPPPSVVNQEFGIHAKHAVQEFLVLQRHASQFAHRVDAIHAQLRRNAIAHSPELRQGPIVPQLLSVRHLVEFSYPHAVIVWLDVLSQYVHRHLAQVQVRPYARRCRYARLHQHTRHHHLCQFPSRHLVRLQVRRHVHHHLIDGIDMDVLG